MGQTTHNKKLMPFASLTRTWQPVAQIACAISAPERPRRSTPCSSARAITVLLAFFMSGCMPTLITGRVSSASYLDISPAATFHIVDSNSLSLSERRIQNLIRERFVARGFIPIVEGNTPDLTVLYSYSIGEGRTEVSSQPDFAWGGKKITTSTEYPRYMQLVIIDFKSYVAEHKLKIYWQAELQSKGSSDDIVYLSEYFLDEIFEQFGSSVDNKRFFKPTSRTL